jgi:NADH-quinone oxidoreductase subunit L
LLETFIYEHAQNILEFITILGAATGFFASSVGLVQNDLKRVIAYSTCSQLYGFFMWSSDYSVGIFHLAHAFF